jgi:hypothetical protein
VNKKVINRKKYVNKNNGIVTSVLDKIFFNIQHINDDGGNIRYTHYKKFLKNWKRCTDLTCAKCGNIVFLDSEDDILFHVKSQKYIVLCDKCRELEVVG